MQRYYRKIIRIRAEDSPNVRLAMAQISRGEKPTNEIIVPGVLSWEEYQKRRQMWDEIQQCVSLDGEFYMGKGIWLFPAEIIKLSVSLAQQYARISMPRHAKAMGIDAAEGGDSTVWTVVDMLGVIFQLSVKTSDTADIPGRTIGLMKEYHILPESVVFDRGGGGKEHADRLRQLGYDVRTIGFGESATPPNQERKTSMIRPPVAARVQDVETKYLYKNRRAEMYGLLSQMMGSEKGFAIPGKYSETLRQLKPLPKQYDGEGRMWLPPKDKPHPEYTKITIRQMIGRSPDEADSLVLAIYGMLKKPRKVMVGAA